MESLAFAIVRLEIGEHRLHYFPVKQLRNHGLKLAFGAIVVLLFTTQIGCQQLSEARRPPESVPVTAGDAQTERDEIYISLAYGVALKDWQTNSPSRRGYNIAAILVDPNGRIVNWGRNCNNRTHNGTQHAEVRLLMGYLARQAEKAGETNKVDSHLKNYTVYTTLEPCAQCAGMMTLLNVRRVVYGQSDPEFGKAFERLELNTTSFRKGAQRGYPPYPRPVHSEPSAAETRIALDQAFKKLPGVILTDFLQSEFAKSAFEAASNHLARFVVRFSENAAVLREAEQYLQTGIPDREPPLDLHL